MSVRLAWPALAAGSDGGGAASKQQQQAAARRSDRSRHLAISPPPRPTRLAIRSLPHHSKGNNHNPDHKAASAPILVTASALRPRPGPFILTITTITSLSSSFSSRPRVHSFRPGRTIVGLRTPSPGSGPSSVPTNPTDHALSLVISVILPCPDQTPIPLL